MLKSTSSWSAVSLPSASAPALTWTRIGCRVDVAMNCSSRVAPCKRLTRASTRSFRSTGSELLRQSVSLSAFAMTKSDDADIATAAISGVTVA